jgi:hypothetical protein
VQTAPSGEKRTPDADKLPAFLLRPVVFPKPSKREVEEEV